MRAIFIEHTKGDYVCLGYLRSLIDLRDFLISQFGDDEFTMVPVDNKEWLELYEEERFEVHNWVEPKEIWRYKVIFADGTVTYVLAFQFELWENTVKKHLDKLAALREVPINDTL